MIDARHQNKVLEVSFPSGLESDISQVRQFLMTLLAPLWNGAAFSRGGMPLSVGGVPVAAPSNLPPAQ
jgi:hypothetical protein